jgi:tripartite ATP-independent transporter DctM subunit
MLTFMFSSMTVLFLLGLPVAFTLVVISLAYLLIQGNIPLMTVAQRFVVGTESSDLMAIPLYMLAGEIMNRSGVTARIFRFAGALVSHFSGGLAHVNVLASFIFSGMSGSELAEASGLGTVEIPAMVDAGYDREFSAVVTAGSATIGPIFPPSIPMVIIGCVAGISIGKLFVGGVIPGIILALYLFTANHVIAKRRGYPKGEKFSRTRLWRTFKEAFPALLAPVIVVGGILSGVFTPTEAGVVAVVYALFVSMLIYHSLNVKIVPDIFVSVAKETAKILFIVGAANAFAWMLAREQLGVTMTEEISAISTNPYVVLTLIVGLFLVAGCFINPSANIIIFVPMLMPLVQSVGIDTIHFGVVSTLALMIGLITPPLGLCMFIVCGIAKISVFQFTRASMPILVVLLLVLATMMYIPQVVTWLPQVLLGK